MTNLKLMPQGLKKSRWLRFRFGFFSGLIFWIVVLFLRVSIIFAATDTRVPTGNDSNTATWALTNGTTWYDVADDPVSSPSDTDYVTIQTNGGGRMTFSFSPFSIPSDAISISSVVVYWRHKDVVSTGANNLGPVLKVNGVYYTGTTVDPGAAWATSNSGTVGSQWTTNPNTSAVWTIDDVNGASAAPLQAFGLSSIDANPDAGASQVYIEVGYVPETTAPATISSFTATVGTGTRNINLSWAAPGDNGSTGQLNPGTFRIFYSTFSNDMTGLTVNTSSTESLLLVDIATSSVNPGTSQYYTLAGLRPGNTYYMRIFTGDETPTWSAISNGATQYATGEYDVTPPAAVTNFAAITGAGFGTIRSTWAATGDDGSSGVLTGVYRIFYSSVSTSFTGLTPTSSITSLLNRVDVSTSGVTPGSDQYSNVASMEMNTTYYFRLFTQDDALNWSGISNGATAYTWGFSISTEPAGSQPPSYFGGLAWGDCNGDGYPDLAATGNDVNGGGGSQRLKVFVNDGTGLFPTIIHPAGNPSTLGVNGDVVWADFNNDGKLDLAAGGQGNIRVYLNTGNGTCAFGGGLNPEGGATAGPGEGIAVGDINNDGLLDLAGGNFQAAATFRFKIYPSTGSGGFRTALNPGGTNTPGASIAFGDYTNDGLLDVGINGFDNTNYRFSVIPNTGYNNFGTLVNPSGANGPAYGQLQWVDYDNDGDLDITSAGIENAPTLWEFIIFKNNGAGTLTNYYRPLGSPDTYGYSATSWADIDNDGDLDLYMNGTSNGTNTTARFYTNNGDGTLYSSSITVSPGLRDGTDAVFADIDGDGDLDMAVQGYDGTNPRLIVYKSNLAQLLGATGVSPAPSAPTGLTASWDYNATNSTVTFKWDSGTYDAGHSSNSLYYNLWVATQTLPSSPPTTGFNSVFTPAYGSPLMGNFIRPAYKTWPGDGAEKYGILFTTTPNTSIAYMKTDTTYYYKVQAISSALKPGTWATATTLRTDVVPAAVSVFTAQTGLADGQIRLNWNSTGDDGSSGTITSGEIKIFYSTSNAEINGATAQSVATSVLGLTSISTSNVAAGAAQLQTLTGLTNGSTYYMRVFLADEVPNWSTVSIGATSYAFGVPSSDIFTSQGSGNWFSTVPNSPWLGGLVPFSTTTVIINTGNVIVATAPVTISSITINSTGELHLDGTSQVIVLTLSNGGKLVNNGVVKVLNDTNNVRIEGVGGGTFTFEGQDVDFNGKKLYFGRAIYTPSLILSSGETLELSDSATFYAFTTQSGSLFIQGTNNDLYLTSNTVISAGTFSKATGTGRVYISGNSNLNSSDENLGHVIIGHSPDRIFLQSPLTAEFIRINKSDTLITNGFLIKTNEGIENFGTIQSKE